MIIIIRVVVIVVIKGAVAEVLVLALSLLLEPTVCKYYGHLNSVK